ncbi:hypothetical protein ACIQI8_21955 [Streptomyces sp. NPDC092369]|uniref:hypothetical protein n=1 Tax=Streptomyces sp. NPDC092369 TaxID=3366015 RepID=UPI003806E849
MKRVLASIGAAASAVVLSPTSASAASGCWGDAGQKSFNGKTYTARYCHNYGENAPVGDARNNWWLYTQGDDAYSEDGWGWFPANKVSGGNNYEPVPGLAIC